jgi:radical SAM superfamily enzyme YgiQ (UPF0313 family)
VSDYGEIDELCAQLRELGARLSVSSLRVDRLSEGLLQALSESDTKTLTLAPEAGSQRLRSVVRKGVTEADVLLAAERAGKHGFRQLKLYFLLGLPTEEAEDVHAIVDLCLETKAHFGGHVIVNITPFVPKAHTPFQWAEMTPSKVIRARLRVLERRLRREGLAVRSESPRWAPVQATYARGDRRLAPVLASLRGNSLGDWRRAMAEGGLAPGTFLGARVPGEPLPWSFVDVGVSQASLLQEWERANLR